MRFCGVWLLNQAVRIKSLLHAPAVRALAIQLATLLALLLIDRVLGAIADFDLPVGLAVMLQGVIAAIASYWFGLALWWGIIQLLFPAALIAVQFLHLPSYIFLLLFIFSLGLFWTTFRTQVPFYPTRSFTWNAVEKLLPVDRPIRFIDIGSGIGGLPVYLAQQRLDSFFSGIEVAPLPWALSVLYSRIVSSKAEFIRGDYLQLDFEHFNVVFAYLSPAAMPALWDKAHREMLPGSLLISYEFSIDDVAPNFVSEPDTRGAVLYVWHL